MEQNDLSEIAGTPLSGLLEGIMPLRVLIMRVSGRSLSISGTKLLGA